MSFLHQIQSVAAVILTLSGTLVSASAQKDKAGGIHNWFMALDPEVQALRERVQTLYQRQAMASSVMLDTVSGENATATTFHRVSSGAARLTFTFSKPVDLDEIYFIPPPPVQTVRNSQFRVISAGRPVTLEIAAIHEDGTQSPPRSITLGTTPTGAVVSFQGVRQIAVDILQLGGVQNQEYLSLSEVLMFSQERNIAPSAVIGHSDTLASTSNLDALVDEIHWYGLPYVDDANERIGWASKDSTSPVTQWIEATFEKPDAITEILLFPARFPAFPSRSSVWFPQNVRILAWESGSSEPFTIAEQSWKKNIGANLVTMRVADEFKDRLWQRIRIVGNVQESLNGQVKMALSEFQLFNRDGENIAPLAKLSASSTAESKSVHLDFATDGKIFWGQIIPLRSWLRGLNERQDTLLQYNATVKELAEKGRKWRSTAFLLTVSLISLMTGAILLQRTFARRKRRRHEYQLREQFMYDLHDEIGGNLGTISLIASQLQHAPPEEEDDLTKSWGRIDDLIESSRSMLPKLAWAALGEAQKLVPALRSLLYTHCGSMSYSIDDSKLKGELPLRGAVSHQIIQFAKEAIQNSAKHSEGTEIKLALTASRRRFELWISDNGYWKDRDEQHPQGLGLRSLQARARSIGASASIEKSRHGTTVKLVLPLMGHRRAPDTSKAEVPRSQVAI